MKRFICTAACFGLAGLVFFAAEESTMAAHKASRKPEGSFNMVGTVSRHTGFSYCMQGNILYDLHSADQNTTAPLSTSSKRDEKLLEWAADNRASVRVEGVWEVGVETGCRWVKVTRVTPAKKK